MENAVALMLFGSFFVLVFIGIPISFSIGIATVSQRLANGLDNFSLLAIPFFIFAGTLMNSGGIAIRLIKLAQVMVGRVPGSLGHVNVLANMMFGSISGSAVAAAAAVGGTLQPIQTRQGYDPAFTTAVNVSSCITGQCADCLLTYRGRRLNSIVVYGGLPARSSDGAGDYGGLRDYCQTPGLSPG